MAKTRLIYELSEEDITEIFRRWVKDSKGAKTGSSPSPTENAGYFIAYARQLGA